MSMTLFKDLEINLLRFLVYKCQKILKNILFYNINKEETFD